MEKKSSTKKSEETESFLTPLTLSSPLPSRYGGNSASWCPSENVSVSLSLFELLVLLMLSLTCLFYFLFAEMSSPPKVSADGSTSRGFDKKAIR